MERTSMKPGFGIILLLLFSAHLTSQTRHTRSEAIEHFCHAPEVSSGPEYERMVSIRQHLAPVMEQVQGHQIDLAVVDSEVFNAWANFPTKRLTLICVPTAFGRLMGDGEGEMAFFYAHEIGHALDDTCKSDSGRAQIAHPTISGELDKLLGGSSRNAVLEQRTCEARADEIGFRVFTAAGYNPFDAAGAFGRIETLLGDTSTGVLSRLAVLGSDHPITPDRIRHMRVLLFQQTHRAIR
jgi:predicted Zn-dependent protease